MVIDAQGVENKVFLIKFKFLFIFMQASLGEGKFYLMFGKGCLTLGLLIYLSALAISSP